MDNFADPEKNVEHLRLPPGAIVADLGAGSGAYVLALARCLKNTGQPGSVYAVDVQKPLLEKVKQEANRRGLSNIHVLWADIEVPGGIKLADGLCDAVVVSNVLFQAKDKPAFLREAARILKPGGQMLVIDWNTHIKPEEVITLAAASGFSKIEQFEAGSHHFGVMFKK